jgi:Domain of unknown function (DUF4304)
MVEIDRKTMERALKDQCVPTLRLVRFKGSFPNFYREDDDFIALVNFQFSLSGGSFCVNLSYADREGRNVYFRPKTEVRKLCVSQTIERLRLGANPQGSDNWFSFGRTSYGEFRGDPIPVPTITANVNNLLMSQAEQWWAEKRQQT